MQPRILAVLPLLMSLACSGTASPPPVDSSADADTGADAGAEAMAPAPSQSQSSDAGATSAESVAIVSSCTLPTAPSPGTVGLVQDLVYASPNGAPQALDVLRPTTPGPHPLVILIHGGGWTTGDKSTMRQLGATLAGLGYVAASLNYRLVQEGGANTFPAQVSDVRCAVRWLHAHAAAYGIDTARIASLGTSAGAQLSAMLGVGDGVSGLDDGTCPAELAAQPVSVHAAAGFYTPTDFRDATVWANNISNGTGVTDMLGAPIDTVPQVAALASPITHVSAASAPFFLAHGTADTRVPVAQSESFEAALHAAGAKATLVEVAGADHGFPVLSADYLPSSCTMLAFLKKYLTP